MYSVYILYSHQYSKIYIGYTSDLKNRLESHNVYGKGYTARFRPWKIIHAEEFDTKLKAIRREKELKSAQGRSFAWSLIKGA